MILVDIDLKHPSESAVKNDSDSEHGTSTSTGDTLSIFSNRWSRKLLSWGVESRGTGFFLFSSYHPQPPSSVWCVHRDCTVTGIVPVPVVERTDTKFSKIFFIWYTGNFNILPFVIHSYSSQHLSSIIATKSHL